jgi:hypothetical protein
MPLAFGPLRAFKGPKIDLFIGKGKNSKWRKD